jgi:tRNA-specific 2-thiouridylase
MNSKYQPKALALISGGLDSLLATKLILDQGVHVEGVNFFTGFCVEGHTHAIRKQAPDKQKRNNALWVAEQLGIKLHIIDIVEEYKRVVMNPKYGYGANLNPCLDCKIFMIGKAKEWIQENGFDFIITGEVVGQRPKSQNKKKMKIVLADTGTEEVLLRPLCAKKLEPTKPELEGWVDREKLYDFSGRGRGPQIDLARKLGFDDYAQPAGGCCFLTDESYSKKLQDLWKNRGEKIYELDDIMLLKVGRHLRPRPHFKLIIAREEGEGRYLTGYQRQFTYATCVSHPGALLLVDGELKPEDRELVARILARFTQCPVGEKAKINIFYKNAISYLLEVQPFSPEEILKEWYV